MLRFQHVTKLGATWLSCFHFQYRVQGPFVYLLPKFRSFIWWAWFLSVRMWTVLLHSPATTGFSLSWPKNKELSNYKWNPLEPFFATLPKFQGRVQILSFTFITTFTIPPCILSVCLGKASLCSLGWPCACLYLLNAQIKGVSHLA